MKTKECKTDTECKTFEDLQASNFCMMYFARGCKEDRLARGLCNKHYHMVRRCVLAGSLTWARVEAQLKALPLQPREYRKDFIAELSVK